MWQLLSLFSKGGFIRGVVYTCGQISCAATKRQESDEMGQNIQN